jgi:colanic acid/amylovoran biosynthesis glycosyltransferase
MRRHLLLFTVSYPFDNGEPFLAQEIQDLSRAFERVSIVPMVGRKITNAVPSNVKVVRPFWGSEKSRYLFYLANILHFRTLTLAAREIWQAAVRNNARHIGVLYRILLWSMYRSALERCEAVTNACNASDDTVAYSYWGHTPALAVPKLRRAGVPCAVRYHRVDLYLDALETSTYLNRNGRYFPWRTEIEAASVASLFISEHGLQYFSANWPDAKHSAKVISRLGVRDYGENPGTGGANSDVLVIASCSSLVPMKRVPLIAAFAVSLAQRRKVRWHHFGAGDIAPVCAELESAGEGLEHYFWGFLKNDRLRQFYCEQRIDLFVNFSSSEGVPVSIMEAISSNIPVVATAVNGTPEVVIDGKSGMLIAPEDCEKPESLADRVLAELAPGGTLARANPRSFWQERFNSDRNYGELAEMLGGLDAH